MGELDGGWRIHWRLKLFYLLVWLQRRVGLALRVSWGALPPEERGEMVALNELPLREKA